MRLESVSIFTVRKPLRPFVDVCAYVYKQFNMHYVSKEFENPLHFNDTFVHLSEYRGIPQIELQGFQEQR